MSFYLFTSMVESVISLEVAPKRLSVKINKCRSIKYPRKKTSPASPNCRILINSSVLAQILPCFVYMYFGIKRSAEFFWGIGAFVSLQPTPELERRDVLGKVWAIFGVVLSQISTGVWEARCLQLSAGAGLRKCVLIWTGKYKGRNYTSKFSCKR